MTTQHTLGQRLAQARRVKSVRDRRDITQADVADAVGYSRTAVSEWEADAKVPREDALVRLAGYLGVTPAFLRYGIVSNPSAIEPISAEEITRAHQAEGVALPEATPEAPPARRQANDRPGARRPKGGR